MLYLQIYLSISLITLIVMFFSAHFHYRDILYGRFGFTVVVGIVVAALAWFPFFMYIAYETAPAFVESLSLNLHGEQLTISGEIGEENIVFDVSHLDPKEDKVLIDLLEELSEKSKNGNDKSN